MIDRANLFSYSNAGEDVISYFSQATEFHAERDIKTEETGALGNLYLSPSEPHFGNLPEEQSPLETMLRNTIEQAKTEITEDIIELTKTELMEDMKVLMPLVKLHEDDDQTKKNLTRGGKMEINNLISKFNEKGKLKLEELLKLTGLKESANNVEKRKIEDIEKTEDFRYHSNISDLTARFNKTGKLEPEEMLSLLESKKYVVEIKKEVFGLDLVIIEAVEKEYFEGIPSFSKELENLLREEPLNVEDARKSLAEFSELVKKHKFKEGHIKLHLMSLEKRLVNTIL